MRWLTAGESHGRALVGIIEGIPSGIEIQASFIQTELLRRKLGFGRGARQKMETDTVQILSGIRHGKTLGSPISLMIENKDWTNWSDLMQPEPFAGEIKKPVHVPRPGHADYIGGIKYKHDDMRNVLERASARETAIRVALACIARKMLKDLGIGIASRVTRIGSICDQTPLPHSLSDLNEIADQRQLRVLDPSIDQEMVNLITQFKKEGNTLGGEFEVIAFGVPLGLGSYAQWDRRLEGKIGSSFLSLNAVKGVEIGMGFELAQTPGSKAHDEFQPSLRPGRIQSNTNRSGGIDGGMSTGQPMIVRAAMKPLATLMSPLSSVRLSTNQPEKAHLERSDVCAVPAAAVIGESLLAFVLAEAILEKFGGDSFAEVQERVLAWRNN